jgi:hypothetical protein
LFDIEDLNYDIVFLMYLSDFQVSILSLDIHQTNFNRIKYSYSVNQIFYLLFYCFTFLTFRGNNRL